MLAFRVGISRLRLRFVRLVMGEGLGRGGELRGGGVGVESEKTCEEVL